MANSRTTSNPGLGKRILYKVLPNPLLKLLRVYVNGIFAILNSTFVLSLPLFLYLLLTTTDFLVLTTFLRSSEHLFFTELGARMVDVSREASEALKAEVGKYIYIFALLLGLAHWKTLYGYAKGRFHWVLLLTCLLSGVLVSFEPTKVVTNTILVYIGLHIAILFAKTVGTRYHLLYGVVLYVLFLVHFGSLIVFFTYNTDLVGFLGSETRYGGLAGNPNSLGATAVMGFWAAASLLSTSGGGTLKRLLAMVAIPLFVLHIVMSGSGTAVVAIIVISIVLVWFRFLSSFSSKTRMAINVLGAIFAVLGILSVLVSSTPAELYLSVTSSLGKDASLTGRTDLWAIARDAISLKPVFGWGFDSHQSVQSVRAFDIVFNHYHNGFLDTLIAGGVVLLLVVLYNMITFVVAFLKAFKANPTVFPLFLPFVLLVFLNLSEYSLLRPNSYVWNIYVAAFVLLTIKPSKKALHTISSDAVQTHYRRRRRRKKQLRWA